MRPIAERRLQRAYRKNLEAGLPLITPDAALEAAEAAAKSGDVYALAGVGRIDPLGGLFKP